jgi:alpha-L-rhamnosidase
MVLRRLLVAAVALAALTCSGTKPGGGSTAVDPSLSSIVPMRLRCEALEAPLAIETQKPRFSWIDVARDPNARSLRQTAWQVVVATSPGALAAPAEGTAPPAGLLWDSQKIEGDATFGVEYAGAPLASHQRLYWSVRIWDERGRASSYAPVADFTMGLLAAADWKAKWIGFDLDRDAMPFELPLAPQKWIGFQGDPEQAPAASRLYHTKLQLPADRKIVKAELLATADDRLTLFLNGVEVVHDKAKFELVADVDVTKLAKPGDNDLRALVTNESVSPAGLLLKLIVKTDDGAQRESGSDATWRATDQPGDHWQEGELDSEKWPAVRVLGTYPCRPWNKLHRGELYLPPTALLRRPFKVEKPVARALVYASALGLVDVHLNGARVSDDRFTPGWTDYSKRVYYRAFDVTGRVKEGANLLGAELADGWYCGYVGWGHQRNHYGTRPRARIQLELEYADGTRDVIGSDESWQAASSATREADFLMGEACDADFAQKSLGAWDVASDALSDRWHPVAVGAEDLGKSDPKVEAHPGPPVEVYAELKPVAITQPKPGAFVFDLGQNFAGVARLKVHGKAGQAIELRFAERLNPDGTIYTTNLRGARARDRYVCRGAAGVETFEPRFTFHGFQYVEVTGLTEVPTPETITGVAFSSATPKAGTFECSNDMLNRLQQNALWTQRSNYIDVPTDCPQRDERLGWTGDAQAYIRAASYQTDVQAFFTKWLVDLDDAQRKDGQFPMVAPLKVAGDDGGPAWADAGVICPWTIYQVYGDRRLLERCYPSMKRFVEFCRSRATPGLLPPEKFHCFGDWLQVDCETPHAVLFEAYFAQAARICEQAATVLGEKEDAKSFHDLYAAVKAAYQKAYVKDDGTVLGDTQCAYVLTLMADLVDGGMATGDLESKVAAKLVAKIEDRNWHLSTGFVGTKDLMMVLNKIERPDVAWRLIENSDYPSWGFTIKQGATSIWERWDGWTPEKGFEDPGMNSFAHYAFGAVYQWMAETIGGIRSAAPGFGKIEFAPKPGGSVEWAKVGYDSIRGPIASEWRFDGERILLDVTVPPNTTAMLHVPTSDPFSVLEGDKAVVHSTGVRVAKNSPDETILELGSGSYHFSAKR